MEVSASALQRMDQKVEPKETCKSAKKRDYLVVGYILPLTTSRSIGNNATNTIARIANVESL